MEARNFLKMAPRVTLGLWILYGVLLGMNPSAKASWLIDPERYHISAHGQLSCQDCHENIQEEPSHPRPEDVTKDLSDFFEEDQCLACHDEVMKNLDNGMHGRKKIGDKEKYAPCLRCHRPHYQARLGENRIGQFEPGKPRRKQCGACHETQTALPPLSDRDEVCMTCHRWVNPDDARGQEKVQRLCFYCHAQGGSPAKKVTEKSVPLINERDYMAVPHADIACTICHIQGAAFNHRDQRLGSCRQCHPRHDEKVSHDAHLSVTCEACHLQGVQPVRDSGSQRILWKTTVKPGETLKIHHMVRGEGEASCRRCHFDGNKIGAVAMILPAKSILCMPCHAGTLSIGDTTTLLSLMVFLAGMVILFSYWLSGSISSKRDAGPAGKLLSLLWGALRTLFSKRIILIIKAVFLDVLLQRRLYRQSENRWLIHSFIFFPFVFRFLWGLVALIGSLVDPEGSWVWLMLNKNDPLTAFVFDLTGIMIIFGVFLALGRGLVRDPRKIQGLPRQDRLALALIGAIVAVGFVLEGMRIAMTGGPDGSEYAMVGYGLSMLFSASSGLNKVYGYIWYLHAILTGIFIAYLPFSRLFHIILAPVTLVMKAVAESKHGRE